MNFIIRVGLSGLVAVSLIMFPWARAGEMEQSTYAMIMDSMILYDDFTNEELAEEFDGTIPNRLSMTINVSGGRIELAQKIIGFRYIEIDGEEFPLDILPEISIGTAYGDLLDFIDSREDCRDTLKIDSLDDGKKITVYAANPEGLDGYHLTFIVDEMVTKIMIEYDCPDDQEVEDEDSLVHR